MAAWPQIARYFTGADVVLVPDNDTAGEKHIGIVEAALKPYAKSMSVARVPAPYKDVTEWVEARGELERAMELNPNYAHARQLHAFYLAFITCRLMIWRSSISGWARARPQSNGSIERVMNTQAG